MKRIIIYCIVLLFAYNINAQTWEKIEMNFPSKDTLILGGFIDFPTKNTGWMSALGSYDTILPRYDFNANIFKTTNGGADWILQNQIINTNSIHKLFTTDSLHCWAYDLYGKLIYTTDGGTNWEETYIAGTPTKYPNNFHALYFFNNVEGIALNLNHPWFTTDGGSSWTKGDSSNVYFDPMDMNFLGNEKGWIVSGTTPYRTDGGYIANTTDGGRTWRYQDSSTHKVFAIDLIDTLNGFAVGSNWNNSTGFVFTTIDGGQNWETTQFLKSGAFWDIGFLDNKNGWILGEGKILNTTDGGKSWNNQIEDLNYKLSQLNIIKKDKAAYAFGDSYSKPPLLLLYADLCGITVGLENIEYIPEEFRLMQNYPNPFNPATMIRYQLPMTSEVSLKIYDILGREVSTLVNEQKSAGNYEVKFDASNFSSGVYLVVLNTPTGFSVQKTTYLK